MVALGDPDNPPRDFAGNGAPGVFGGPAITVGPSVAVPP